MAADSSPSTIRSSSWREAPRSLNTAASTTSVSYDVVYDVSAEVGDQAHRKIVLDKRLFGVYNDAILAGTAVRKPGSGDLPEQRRVRLQAAPGRCAKKVLTDAGC